MALRVMRVSPWLEPRVCGRIEAVDAQGSCAPFAGLVEGSRAHRAQADYDQIVMLRPHSPSSFRHHRRRRLVDRHGISIDHDAIVAFGRGDRDVALAQIVQHTLRIAL